MKRIALLFAAFALVAGVGACGGEEDESAAPETVEGTLTTETGGGGGQAGEGNAAAGKTLYDENGCGGCHTYGPAGSSGNVGPNLDDSEVSFDEAFDQIEHGGGGMPPFGDKLSDEQIADLAAFVTQGS